MTIQEAGAVETTARVVAQFRGRYVVRSETGDRDAVLAGRFRHAVTTAEQLPAVGDWVATTTGGPGELSQIIAVLPRRSAFRRKTAGDVTEPQVIAANVDIAIVASALPDDVNLRRIERYLTLAWQSGAMPLVVLTKSDLVDDADAVIAVVRAVAPGTDVLAVSTFTGSGIADLAARLTDGTTSVLLGSSGVGKSTLVNALLGDERQRTAGVRTDGRGRHTTTHRELLTLPGGGCVIDTPGLREIQLWTADDGIDVAFDDVASLSAQCRFRDCAHDTEPGCAVRGALARGVLDEARFRSWQELRRELAYLERKQDAAAALAARNSAKSVQRLYRRWLNDKHS